LVFAKFCRKFSVILLALEIIWALAIAPDNIFSLTVLVTISTVIVCIFIYGLGEITASLQYIRTMMAEQQEIREEEHKKQDEAV
jgi:flagellar biosynthesis protein FlhB